MTEAKVILIAEDDELVRESIRIVLEASGFEILEAATGQAALEILSTKHCDAIVTDVWMPSKSGIDLLRSAREAGHTQPCVFISGGSSHEALELTVAKAEAYGASTFVMKPFTADELLGALKEAVG